LDADQVAEWADGLPVRTTRAKQPPDALTRALAGDLRVALDCELALEALRRCDTERRRLVSERRRVEAARRQFMFGS
jgi:hypothetical protein